jgi:hypothetical protein
MQQILRLEHLQELLLLVEGEWIQAVNISTAFDGVKEIVMYGSCILGN